MEKEYLEIARFTKPQGLKGELRAAVYCDSPDVLNRFERFYLGEGKIPVKAELSEIRKGFVIMRISGVNGVEAARKLAGEILYINRGDYALPENTWFVGDLIGLDVVDADSGRIYGKVEEILQNAPKDVYSVRAADGKQLLFPAIPEVLVDVDVSAGKISIRPLEGLFDI
ncbi:MAG: ribosome maturation factor RimM [Oscillospiraceae bacterium]|jgi:16S rRNA processing protein RimM|nr:ribosome maturation factor RimM [Oscillospiraceae bacterium]